MNKQSFRFLGESLAHDKGLTTSLDACKAAAVNFRSWQGQSLMLGFAIERRIREMQAEEAQAGLPCRPV